jgi:mannobiose 2-epimerase
MINPVIQEGTVPQHLQLFRREIEHELRSILSFWTNHTIDEQYGGFYGSMDHHNTPDILAPKGSVLNCRILWTFSAAYNFTHQQAYLKMANRAYQYIITHFIDSNLGGVYWTVDHAGHPFDTKKQVYSQAFALYAISEYYKATRDNTVKELAIQFYNLIEHYSYDRDKEGYLEAFTAEWEALADLRLSAKDVNEKKSMNTHLHVLEAYTNLYSIWPDEGLRRQITRLVNNFATHIINAHTSHLRLFFDENWQSKSSVISFGHDIETSWLLAEATDIVADHELVIRIKKICLQMAYASIQAIDSDGGMWYEQDGSTGNWVKEKHWWPQAEAMVGYFHAWQSSGNNDFLRHALHSWTFIKQYIVDKEHGEWHWGVLNDPADDHTTIMSWEDKVGLWKCPYHNTRACLELLKRIDKVTEGRQ